MMIDTRIESGMEMQTISVLRQEPRNSRIISAGQAGGDGRLLHHAHHRRAHEDRLIEDRRDLQFLISGSVAQNLRQRSFDASARRPASKRCPAL